MSLRTGLVALACLTALACGVDGGLYHYKAPSPPSSRVSIPNRQNRDTPSQSESIDKVVVPAAQSCDISNCLHSDENLTGYWTVRVPVGNEAQHHHILCSEYLLRIRCLDNSLDSDSLPQNACYLLNDYAASASPDVYFFDSVPSVILTLGECTPLDFNAQLLILSMESPVNGSMGSVTYCLIPPTDYPSCLLD